MMMGDMLTDEDTGEHGRIVDIILDDGTSAERVPFDYIDRQFAAVVQFGDGDFRGLLFQATPDAGASAC